MRRCPFYVVNWITQELPVEVVIFAEASSCKFLPKNETWERMLMSRNNLTDPTMGAMPLWNDFDIGTGHLPPQ
jgi:hypothetical protein